MVKSSRDWLESRAGNDWEVPCKELRLGATW